MSKTELESVKRFLESIGNLLAPVVDNLKASGETVLAIKANDIVHAVDAALIEVSLRLAKAN